MRQHAVTFLSPGTFVSEQTEMPIEAWNPQRAMELGAGITERYGAKPYAFYFTTKLTAPPVPDGEGGELRVQPREVERSGLFHICGEVFTYDQLVERNDPREEILRSNMRCNDWPLVVVTQNSYRHTAKFEPGDCVVDASGNVTARGDEEPFRGYRAAKVAAWDAERARLVPLI